MSEYMATTSKKKTLAQEADQTLMTSFRIISHTYFWDMISLNNLKTTTKDTQYKMLLQ